MEQVNINKFSITLNFIKCIFLSLAFSGFSVSLANDLYSVKPFIDISNQSSTKTTWLAPITNTKRDNELFLVNTRGEIYRAEDEEVSQLPIINLSTHIKKQTHIVFTALTLHPNFHLLDQEGSNIIYTSHIEVYDPSTKENRIPNNDIKQNFTHDAVIIEWQLSNTASNQVNVYKQREVLRIATSSIDVNINQLSFNPYLKPWSDDFGLLYISIKSDEKSKNLALYSGSILRIQPNKLGLRNYTIPLNNPFIKNPDIEDEIFILGAQNIQQFTWSKKSKNQLIITHKFNEKTLISNANIGSNYLLTEPFNIIYKHEIQNASVSTAYYRGNELNTLWNKILFIEKADGDWHLNAISVSKKVENEQPSSFAFTLNQINNSHLLSLYITHKNEVLLWDHTQAVIYKVSLNLVRNNEKDVTEKQPQNDNFNILIYSLSIFFFFIIVFYIKRKYRLTFSSKKSLLKSTFSHFNFNIKNNEITLFKRHEAQVNTTISTLHVLLSEIYLNNTLINTVTIGAGSEFNVQKENSLRLSFEQEHRDKMVDDKIRQITLKITTVKAEKYIICAYLREGNQRLTREKYHDVVDKLVDWNWYFSSIISSDATPERPLKVELKKQKTIVKPEVTKAATKQNEDLNSEPNMLTSTVVTKQVNKVNEAEAINKTSKTANTKLIEALNKLASLKEQGYLSEEEFALAKNKLLNNLTNND